MFGIISQKRCPKCRETKATANFYKSRKTKDGFRSWCKDCHNADVKRRQRANPEKLKSNNKKWQVANKERFVELQSRWRKNNPDKVKAMERKYTSTHPEKMHEKSKKYYENNKEKVRTEKVKWIAAHPGANRQWSQARRARILGNGGTITGQQWIDMCARFDNKCLCCGAIGVRLELDHVVPLKLGGVNTIENAQPLCRSCNGKKGIKHIDYRK